MYPEVLMYPYEFFHKSLRAWCHDIGTPYVSDIAEKGLFKEVQFKIYVGGTDQPKTMEIGYFNFSPMPGCCGVVVSHYTYLNKNFRHTSYSDEFRELKEVLAKKFGYSCMIATTVMTDLPAVGNMMKSKYKIDTTFINKRTKNMLGIGVKIL